MTNAAVLLDNTYVGVYPYIVTAISDPFKHGIAFHTGSTSYVLNSVTVLPVMVNSTQTGTIDFMLYNADATGKPTSLITSVTRPTTFKQFGLASSADYSTSQLDSNFVINKNSNYALVITSSFASARLAISEPDTPYSVSNSGLSYLGRVTTSGTAWGTVSPVNNALFRLSGSVVPEPSTYVLAAIATCMIAFLVRRRNPEPLV